MRRSFKILTVSLWAIAVGAMVGMVALQMLARDRQTAVAAIPDMPPDSGRQVTTITAPNFSLTDQLGRTVTTSDLRGHPWIADFIFTECTSACPIMTAHLAGLQKQIDPSVKFISFSVDPDHDTPPALLAYARQYNADNDRWRFLTGEKSALYAAIAGMKVSIVQPATGNQIEHDIHFLLVDKTGRVWNVYDSRTQATIDELVHDANALATETAQ